MRDYLELATTVPSDEPCAQVGSDNYTRNSRLEAEAFRDQIYRVFGDPPAGTGIRIKSCPHDFGSYLDLQIAYDDDEDDSCGWTFEVESNLPERWDEIALKKLKEDGYEFPK
jgi:hypothetical protein